MTILRKRLTALEEKSGVNLPPTVCLSCSANGDIIAVEVKPPLWNKGVSQEEAEAVNGYLLELVQLIEDM